MSTSIPVPLRAVAGLAAVAIDEVRRLPDRLISLPVLAVSTALQASLKAQQRYAALVSRGDQLLGQLRGEQDGTPPWARFDDEPPPSRARSAFDAADDLAVDDHAAAAGDGTVVQLVEVQVDGDVVAEDMAEEAIDDAIEEAIEVAAVVDTVGAADVPPASSAGPGGDSADLPRAEEEIAELAGETAGYDGYLTAEPPLPGYDTMSIPQLRARLRRLSERQLEELVAYERATAERAPYLTMLENRLATVRGR